MIEDEQENCKEDESLCCVMSTLNTIYEVQNKANLLIFKGILQETIPFILYSSSTKDPYFAVNTSSTNQSSFRTCFFRIENISNSVICLSLLRPVDVEGNYLETIGIPYRLEKTNIKISPSIKEFCSIQCINPKLVNRKIIISDQK